VTSRICLAFVVVTVGCVVIVSAFGAANRSYSGDRHLRYATLPHGWLFGIPHNTRRDSRLVGRVGGRQLAVAPTRNGSFCEAFRGVIAGCRVRKAGTIGPTIVARGGLVDAVGGDVVTTESQTRLYVDVEAASGEQRVPTTWIGPPISAGFFYVEFRQGVKNVRLVLKRPDGAVAAETPILRVRIPKRRS
jgi:hypothetical protein